MKAQSDEGGGRILLGDNTGGGVVICCRLVSSVLELRFQLYSCVCTYTVDHTYTQFILAQNFRLGSDLPERNYEYCVSMGASVP